MGRFRRSVEMITQRPVTGSLRSSDMNNGSQVHRCTGAWVPVHRFMVLGFKLFGFPGSARVLGFELPGSRVRLTGSQVGHAVNACL